MNVPLNIDWQQILLHLFNFIILAGGLYFLLYKPVKAFMQKRTDYYAEMDSSAKKALSDAEDEKKKYAEALNGAKNEISDMKAAAVRDADRLAKERISEAEEEKKRIINEAKAAAESQKDKILLEANSEIEGLVSAAVDKALKSSGDSFDDFLNAARKE